MKDERLEEIEREKQQELAKNNQQLDNLAAEREDLTNEQNNLVDRWEQTNNDTLDKQLAFQKDLINQQKEEAKKNYEDEARSAYSDYRRETNDYGVTREKLADQGLAHSGYSESSRIGMYSAYQNRLGMARKGLDKAYLDFNNAIKEAQLTNDTNKAQNALKTLENKLQISLEGFNYKDALARDRMNMEMQTGDRYYNRYQNTINQINYEQEQAENRRRYEQEMAYKKQQDAQAQRNWEREYALRNRPVYRGGGSSSRKPSGNGTILSNPKEEPKLSKFAKDMVTFYDTVAPKWDKKGTRQNSPEWRARTLAYSYNKGQINEYDLRYLSKYLGVENYKLK